MIIHEWSASGGDEFTEGRRFGSAWARQLAATRDDYLGLFAASGIDRGIAESVADACRIATDAHRPRLSEEMRGIAEGSGMTPRDVWLLAARTEILARTPSRECSAIVHIPVGGGAPRTLQTWDWLAALATETVVRRLSAASGARVATFCEFGQPAKIGVNDRGLGLHFNILHHRSDGTRAGVPVHVLARAILEDAATVAEAVAIAERTPLAASSVLTVVASSGGAPEAAAIEVSPAGIAVIPVAQGGTLAHTNHFLDPRLAEGERPLVDETSRPRLDCLLGARELASLPSGRERALAFGAIPGAPISVRPDPADPPQDAWETKLTIAIDVARGRLEFCAGAPADAAVAEWRTVAA